MPSVSNTKPINEDLYYFLEVLAEVAITNFDDDRAFTKRELLEEFVRVVQKEPELLQAQSHIVNPDLSNLLKSLDRYLNKSHWDGNNLESLQDAFRAYKESSVFD